MAAEAGREQDRRQSGRPGAGPSGRVGPRRRSIVPYQLDREGSVSRPVPAERRGAEPFPPPPVHRAGIGGQLVPDGVDRPPGAEPDRDDRGSIGPIGPLGDHARLRTGRRIGPRRRTTAGFRRLTAPHGQFLAVETRRAGRFRPGPEAGRKHAEGASPDPEPPSPGGCHGEMARSARPGCELVLAAAARAGRRVRWARPGDKAVRNTGRGNRGFRARPVLPLAPLAGRGCPKRG